MRLATALAVLALASTAQAFNLRSGSWGYEYPPKTYPYIVRDGQPVALTGGQGFSFTGTITDYWDDLYNCPPFGGPVPATQCIAGKMALSWYAGTGSGTDYRGSSLQGVVHWNGGTYQVGGSSGNSLRFFVYGRMTVPAAAPNGTAKVKTALIPLLGSFTHGGVTTPIGGQVNVTVEFERENGAWEIEGVDYDVVPL